MTVPERNKIMMVSFGKFSGEACIFMKNLIGCTKEISVIFAN